MFQNAEPRVELDPVRQNTVASDLIPAIFLGLTKVMEHRRVRRSRSDTSYLPVAIGPGTLQDQRDPLSYSDAYCTKHLVSAYFAHAVQST